MYKNHPFFLNFLKNKMTESAKMLLLQQQVYELETKNDELDEQVYNLEQQVYKLETKNDTLEPQVYKLDNKNDVLERKVYELGIENDILERRVHEYRIENDALERKVSELDIDSDEYQTSNDQLESENKKFEQDNLKLSIENQKYVNIIDSLKKEMSENFMLESMNDMKKKYEDIEKRYLHRIPREVHHHLLFKYRESLKIINTVETIHEFLNDDNEHLKSLCATFSAKKNSRNNFVIISKHLDMISDYYDTIERALSSHDDKVSHFIYYPRIEDEIDDSDNEIEMDSEISDGMESE